MKEEAVRHRNSNRKLSKPTDQRMALLGGLVISLLTHGSIKTTLTRAKEAKKMAEKVITLTKKGDIPARRKAFTILKDRDLIKKVFTEMPTRFNGRAGGYTRIIKIAATKGDNAPRAILELI